MTLRNAMTIITQFNHVAINVRDKGIMGTKLKKRSLAEELTELSNPRPLAYHPDLEDLDDLTAAKVCSFSGEEEEELDIKGASRGKKPIRSRRKVKYLDEEDVKYAGRAISRKDLDEDIYNGELIG